MAKTTKTTKANGKAARRGPASAKAKGKGKGKPGGGRGGKKLAPRRDKAPRRSAPPVRRATAPARRAAPAPTTHAAPDVARPTALAIAKAALDKKGEDVLVLDVRGLTSYADYFVVVTADSDRQASAIAEHVEQTMKEQGVGKVGVEGYESGRWILVDYGDVVAHVMNRESRGFYDLEGLWADAPRFAVQG
ncbi:MAG TPA: ribosome silencing factor [Anaeromyxobacter sp.]